MSKYLSILFVIVLLFSCDNKEDIFKQKNITPEIGLKKTSSPGEYLSVLIDTFKRTGEGYNAKIKIADNNNLESIAIQYTFLNDKGGSIVIEDSNFKYIPDTTGLNDITITVTDPYGKWSNANLQLMVYDNYPPIPFLTFKKLENNNYRVDASVSYDPDGTIVNYHFEYGVSSIDFNEPIVNIWADHVELNGGVTLTLTDDQGGVSEPKFFELN